MATLIVIAALAVPAQAGRPFSSATATPTATPRSLFPFLFPAKQAGETFNPGLLSSPDSPLELASSRPLNLLAGKLIFTGLVNASSCADGGILRNGAATPCGERAAHNAVVLWQNQFDEAIYNAAIQQGVPPYLLKNVIGQESQYWPGNHSTRYGYSEYGLGQFTNNGADTLLRWNNGFAHEFCLQIYTAETCKTPYGLMPASQQSLLRGAIIQRVDADCANCPGRVDLQRSRNSVIYVAAALRASYNSAKYYVEGLTGRSFANLDPGDAWRISLIGYHNGPGCLASAISRARSQRLATNWKNISNSLDTGCESSIEYVRAVKNLQRATDAELRLAQRDASIAASLVIGFMQPTDVPPLAPEPTTTAASATETASVTPEPTTTAASATGTASVTPEPTTTAASATETASVTPEPTTTAASATETASTTPEPTTTAASATETASVTPEPTMTAASATGTASVTPEPTMTAASATETASVTPEPTTTLISPVTETPTVEPPTSTPEPPATATPTAEPVTPTVTPEPVETVEILVKFKGLVPNFIASGIIKSAGGEVTDKTNGIGLNVVAVPEDQAEDLIQGLTDNLLVDYAEPNHTARAFYAPNDPGFSDQTNLSVMQVPFAWDVTRGENVIVAVIDTGLDFTHPDLISNLWANPGEMGTDVNGNDKASNGMDDDNDGYVDNWLGWNFVDNNNDLADGNGHGTHSAGVIGAGMDNALGIAGIAPGARILPIKALNDQGYGSYADVARAIVYAVDHGARVINLGFGGQAESQALRDATDYAHQHDAVVVAAAGNGASDAPYYPAANPNVIAALALDPSLALTSFSSYGYVYSVGAPGMGIFSTVTGGGTGTLDGSSVSAAEVSGVAALLASRPQFDTADKIRGAIFGSARDLGAAGHDPYFGYGLVQALDALAYNPSAFQTPTPSPTPAGTATPIPTGIPTGVAIQVDAPNADINNYTRSCPTGAVFGALNGTNVPAVQVDDGASAAIPVGFDFWHMGARYTSVYASSNGWLSFSDPLGNSYPNNNAPTLANALPRPMLAPLWDDLSGVGGTASYATTGTAPNRVFTFEWFNWRWSSGAAGATISFRVELYESSGVTRFRYVRDAAPVVAGSASVGMTGSSVGPGTFLAVNPNTSFTTVCPSWDANADPANIFGKPPSGKILTFTPPTPADPTDLRVTASTANTATLTWTDNASNENGYVIYASTDGVNFTTQAGLTPGWQANAIPGTGSTGTTTVTGLSNVEQLYWRVYAVSEGRLSAAPAAIHPPSALTFTNFQPTSATLNWVDSPDDAGYVILNSTNGTDFAFVAQVPANAISYNAGGLTAGVSYAWRVQAINPRAASSAIQGSTPAVVITAPADNSTFLQSNTIHFDATATDALQGDLTPVIEWSSDIDGALGTGGSLNRSSMSLGQHVITAEATSPNGLTAVATITITVTDAGGNVPPQLFITAPVNNSVFMQGANVTFTGTANDLQDGNLSVNIQWSSSIDGALGTGSSVSTNALSVGIHIITAQVTDSDNLTSTKTIRVYVTDLNGNLPPDLVILSPVNNASFQQGDVVGFLGRALIASNGDISGHIQWTSSLDGALAADSSSFGSSALSVGAHTITASVTDANSGLIATAAIAIIVQPPAPAGDDPHGMFNGSVDTCAACHAPHSAESWGPLVQFPDSPYQNNDYCLSCHSSGAQAYSTHSNMDATAALEQPFELLCIQCHDPHGSQPNLSNIRRGLKLGTLPSTFDAMTDSGSSVLFTARTGAGSFDDGSNPASQLCAACHQSAANPGAPMTLHNGGANHNGGRDYAGQDCAACHPHSVDSDVSTRDGFTTTCRACHSQPQDAGNGTPRRQIVGYPAGSGGNDNDFARASRHVEGNDAVADADCVVCHEMTRHTQGKVRLYNEDAPSIVYTLDYLKDGANDAAEYESFCLSCHDSNGKAGNLTPFSDKKVIPSLSVSLWNFAQHNVVRPLFSASCLDCHSNGHGSNKASLLSQYSASAPWDYQYLGSGAAPADVMDQEEDFCAKCHSASGPGKDIQTAFTNYANTATRIFKHDVGNTYQRHNPSEVFAGLFGGANRHVECADCHDSHAAKDGATLPPTLPLELRGASGVEPVYSGSGAPLSYNFLARSSAEYQICFKCHSGYTTLPTYLPDGWNGASFTPNGLYKLTTSALPQIADSRDMALEFNPNAASFHGVLAPGKNPNMPDSFVPASGWTGTSRLYCSSCHTNANPAADGSGTHGSPCLHLLRDAVNDATCNQYTTVWAAGRPNDNEVCFACHRSDVYNASARAMNVNLTVFRSGQTTNLHWKHSYEWGISCYTCHDSHGSEQLHLINFDASVVELEPGYTSQSAWQASLNPNGTTATASCYTGPGGCHSAQSYTP
ncbi:MAG: hypothetical protein PGMFKBFP_01320 [Anaerolineales bacterium]|nr:hypothetical protein [Anaerolineales bacterium]